MGSTIYQRFILLWFYCLHIGQYVLYYSSWEIKIENSNHWFLKCLFNYQFKIYAFSPKLNWIGLLYRFTKIWNGLFGINDGPHPLVLSPHPHLLTRWSAQACWPLQGSKPYSWCFCITHSSLLLKKIRNTSLSFQWLEIKEYSGKGRKRNVCTLTDISLS